MSTTKLPRGKYEWDRVFEEPQFTLTRGTDYTCSQSAICQQIRNAASVRGIKVSIEESPNSFKVTITDRGRVEAESYGY